jgi:hypothetical protein
LFQWLIPNSHCLLVLALPLIFWVTDWVTSVTQFLKNSLAFDSKCTVDAFYFCWRHFSYIGKTLLFYSCLVTWMKILLEGQKNHNQHHRVKALEATLTPFSLLPGAFLCILFICVYHCCR